MGGPNKKKKHRPKWVVPQKKGLKQKEDGCPFVAHLQEELYRALPGPFKKKWVVESKVLLFVLV